ncbi:hypothetical protein HHI36_013218 [Cryptolaemus montrouzieri]|uniref:G-protein coupled receptors family 1 profile domain-containing protein n=1 Tax=Cryptolaemus montrouzieri TaxID=559131 RepID=A0ABD2NHJ7_9CUCU
MLNNTSVELFSAVNDSILNTSVTAFTSSDVEFDSCLKEEPERLQFFRFLTNGLLLNIIGLLGIIGNIISMIILSRPQMRSSINYLLIGLARIDTALIITSILLFGLPGIYPYSGMLFTYYYVIYPQIVPVVYPLALIVQAASAYLTFCVSFERFVAVCHPLKVRSLCTYGRARLYVIGILCVSVLYNISRFWESSLQAEWWPERNVTVYCPIASSLRSNPTYRTIYIHWCYFIFIYLLPFLGIAVLNAAIYRQGSDKFRKCGYPPKLLQKQWNTHGDESQGIRQNSEFRSNLKLPNMPRLTDKLSHILKDEDTRVVKYCTKTGQSLFSRVKERLSDNLTPNCINMIECKNCSARYVGQTKQLLTNRMRSHKSDCDLARKNKSKKPIATVLHSLKYNEFDYENPKVLP